MPSACTQWALPQLDATSSSSRNTPSTPLHLQPVKRCVVCPGQKVSVWHEQSLIACNGCKVKSETIERVQIIFLKQSLRKMYALNLKYNIFYNFVSVCFQPRKVSEFVSIPGRKYSGKNPIIYRWPHIPIFFIRYLTWPGNGIVQQHCRKNIFHFYPFENIH